MFMRSPSLKLTHFTDFMVVALMTISLYSQTEWQNDSSRGQTKLD